MMINNNTNDDETVLSIMTEESIDSNVLREVLAITSDGHHELGSSRSSTDDAAVAPMNTISSESNNSLLQTPTLSGSEEIKLNESDANLSVMLDAMLIEVMPDKISSSLSNEQQHSEAALLAVLDESAFAPAADAAVTAIDDSNDDDNIFSIVTEDCPSLAPTDSTISVATERASLHSTPSNDDLATAAQASAELPSCGTQKLGTTNDEEHEVSALRIMSPVVLQDGTTTVFVAKSSKDESPPVEEEVPCDVVLSHDIRTATTVSVTKSTSEEVVSPDDASPAKVTVSEQPDVPIADDTVVETKITASSSPEEATPQVIAPEPAVLVEPVAPFTDNAFVTLGIVSSTVSYNTIGLDASMLPTVSSKTSKPATKPPRTKSLSMKKLQFGSIKSLVKNDPVSVPALSTIRKSIPTSSKGLFGMKKYNTSRMTTTKAPKKMDEKDFISTEVIDSIKTDNSKVLAAIALIEQNTNANDVRTKLEADEDGNREEECRDDTDAINQLSNNDIEEKSVSAVEDEPKGVTEEYTAMPTVMDGMNYTIKDKSLSVDDEYTAMETVMDESNENDTIKDQSLCNLDDMALGITAGATILGAIVGDAVKYVVDGFSGQNIEGQIVATVYPHARDTVNEQNEFVESANERDEACNMISKDETKDLTETQAMVVPHTDLAAKKLLAMEKVTKRTAVIEMIADDAQQDYPINCCIELKLVDDALERLNAKMTGRFNVVKLTSATNEKEELIVIPNENETPHMIGLKNSSEFDTVEDEIPIVEESIIDETAKLDEKSFKTAEIENTNKAASPINICVEQSISGFMIDATNAVSVLSKAFNESLTELVGNISTKENDDGNIEILASNSITTIPIVVENIRTTKEAIGLDEVYVSSPACNAVEPVVNVGDSAALSTLSLQSGEQEKKNTTAVKCRRFKSLSSIMKLQRSSGLIDDDEKTVTNTTEDIDSKEKLEQGFDKDDIKDSMADIDEITSLITDLSLPKSADKMLNRYKGREDDLLANLKKMKAKQTNADISKADESEAIIAEITSLLEELSLPKSVDEMLTEYKGREDELLKNLKLIKDKQQVADSGRDNVQSPVTPVTDAVVEDVVPPSNHKERENVKPKPAAPKARRIKSNSMKKLFMSVGLIDNSSKGKTKGTTVVSKSKVAEVRGDEEIVKEDKTAVIAEITSLIADLSLPKSSGKMLEKYKGQEEELLNNLKKMKAKQKKDVTVAEITSLIKGLSLPKSGDEMLTEYKVQEDDLLKNLKLTATAEITSLITDLSLPKSADKMLKKYKGREGGLLMNFKKMKAKQTNADISKADESEAIIAETTSLIKELNLPKSDEMLTEYKGREDELLKNLKLIKDKQQVADSGRDNVQSPVTPVTDAVVEDVVPPSNHKERENVKPKPAAPKARRIKSNSMKKLFMSVGLIEKLSKGKMTGTTVVSKSKVAEVRVDEETVKEDKTAVIAEITSLITVLSLPKSSGKMLEKYKGRKEELLNNLKNMKAKQKKDVTVAEITSLIKELSLPKSGDEMLTEYKDQEELLLKNLKLTATAEITSLITDLSLPKSADKMLEKYKGREEELLNNLKKMKANQAEDDISTNVEKVATIAEITSLIEELNLPKSVDEMLTNYKGREDDLLKNLKLIEVIDVVMEDAVSSIDLKENMRERSRPAMLSMDFSGSIASDLVYDKDEKQAKSVEIEELSNTIFTERKDESWTRSFLAIKDKIENYVSTTAKSVSDLDKLCGPATSIESDSDSIWPDTKTTSMACLSITSQANELNEIQTKLEEQNHLNSKLAHELSKLKTYIADSKAREIEFNVNPSLDSQIDEFNAVQVKLEEQNQLNTTLTLELSKLKADITASKAREVELEQQRTTYAEELKKIEDESQQENKVPYAEQLTITKDEYSKESMAYKKRIEDLKSKCEVLAQVARVKCETLKSLAQQTKEETEQTINAQADELEKMRALLKIIGVDSTVGQQSFESTHLQQVESIEIQERGPRLPPSVIDKSKKSWESFPETTIDRTYPKRSHDDVREIKYDCVSDDSSTNASYSIASTHSSGEGSWLTKFSLFWSKKEERDEVNERDYDSGQFGDNRIIAL